MKKISFLLMLALVSTLQFCTSSKKASATNDAGKVSYIANVQPLIMAHCSPCHIPPKGFKKALDTYESAKSNITGIITRIKRNPGDPGFMPMKHEKLSDSIINVFVQWKETGALEK